MITKLFFAITLGIFIGGIAGYLGSLMLTKRMSLVAGPLGHLTLPGMSIALAYNFDVSLGALVFLVFGTILIWWFQQKTKLPFEAITATVFSSSLAMSFLILPKGKTKGALIGDLSQISPFVVLITILSSLIIFVTIRQIYSKMILMRISKDLAKSKGIKIKLLNFIYLTCVGIVVALGVRIVGGLMTAALVAIPACTSKNISSSLNQYAYISLLVGSVSCAIGIFISSISSLPPGPMIIISSTTMFIVSIFMKPKFLTNLFNYN